MSEITYDHFFYVLSNKHRLRVLLYLIDNCPTSVSEIANNLHLEQSVVSHSLRQLLVCHFVSVKQSGKERIYSINNQTVRPIFKLINKHISKFCVEQCNHSKRLDSSLKVDINNYKEEYDKKH